MAADPEVAKATLKFTWQMISILVPFIVGMVILGLFLIFLRSKIDQWFNKKFFSKSETCPRCGAKLIKKNSKFGTFLGCSNYPKCNFTKN